MLITLLMRYTYMEKIYEWRKVMIYKLMKEYEDLDATYKGGLTNHLTMSLYALSQLGADEMTLKSFAKTYISRTELHNKGPITININSENWKEYCGNGSHYSSYVEYFNAQVETHGLVKTVRFYLNELVDGSAGDAFHGIIRLGYAIEMNDEAEIARALAYFADSYCPFHVDYHAIPIKEPLEQFKDLERNERFKNRDFSRNLIIGRMKDVYEDPKLLDIIAAISDDYFEPERFRELVLELYASTEDFTMLHGLTSTHALGVLYDYFDDPLEVYQKHWIHLQIAYLSTNCTTLFSLPSLEDVDSWSSILQKAIKSEDPHTLKLVYSVFEESKHVRKAQTRLLYQKMACKKVNE